MHEMSAMEQISHTKIQSKVFDFALTDLIISKRASFQPLWTIDSWAKFLIWMALNCGLSGERDSLEMFANALGPNLTRRMRKIFFERILEELGLYVLADPADKTVLILPITGEGSITKEKASQILPNIGLTERVAMDSTLWVVHDGMIEIPWKPLESDI